MHRDKKSVEQRGTGGQGERASRNLRQWEDNGIHSKGAGLEKSKPVKTGAPATEITLVSGGVMKTR